MFAAASAIGDLGFWRMPWTHNPVAVWPEGSGPAGPMLWPKGSGRIRPSLVVARTLHARAGEGELAIAPLRLSSRSQIPHRRKCVSLRGLVELHSRPCAGFHPLARDDPLTVCPPDELHEDLAELPPGRIRVAPLR